MENIQQQILSEIKSLMASVRVQLEQLDAKMAELQQVYEPQEFEAEPIDVDFEMYAEPSDLAEPFVEPEPVAEQESVPEPEPIMEPEPVAAPETEPEPKLIQDEEPVEKPSESVVLVAVIDVMAKKHAWRSDMPGSPVKDVRAAIALVDRALFINSLFGENAMAFLETLNRINQSESLDDVVEYLAQTYPHWDFDSDVVYRFMMAVRRKIN